MNEGVASLCYLRSTLLAAGGGLQSRYSTHYGREGCSTRVLTGLLPALPLLLISSPSTSSLYSSAAASLDPSPGRASLDAARRRRHGPRCAEGPRRPGAAVPHHEAPQ